MPVGWNQSTGITNCDGIQLSNHRFLNPGMGQFRMSCRPECRPFDLVNRLRYHIQEFVRSELPHAFDEQFRIRSIGVISRQTIEGILVSELDEAADKAESADPVKALHIQQDVDLSIPQRSEKILYSYNLHVVLEQDATEVTNRKTFSKMAHDQILRECQRRTYRMLHAVILTDYIEFVLGCPLTESPASVALAFMNSLADASFGRPVFRFGAFIYTFGEEEWNETVVP